MLFQNLINKIGYKLEFFKKERELYFEQYEDKEDYKININSAQSFFSNYSFFLKQRMMKIIVEEDQHASKLIEIFEQLAIAALVDTFISSAYRIPKKKWWNLYV